MEIRKIVFGIMLAMYLGALDQAIVATALPTIGRRFGEIGNLSWVVTAYLLTSTAVTPLYGKLSDMHGRQTMMLIGIGVFMAGSLACAVAPNMLMLILARVAVTAAPAGCCRWHRSSSAMWFCRRNGAATRPISAACG